MKNENRICTESRKNENRICTDGKTGIPRETFSESDWDRQSMCGAQDLIPGCKGRKHNCRITASPCWLFLIIPWFLFCEPCFNSLLIYTCILMRLIEYSSETCLKIRKSWKWQLWCKQILMKSRKSNQFSTSLDHEIDQKLQTWGFPRVS